MIPLRGFHFKTSIPIRFADIDAFGHVNNAVYLTYFEIARTHYWDEIIKWDWNKMGIIIGKVEINFLKPINLKDEILTYVRTSRVGKASFDVDYAIVKLKNGIEELCTTGSTVCVAFNYLKKQSAPIPDWQRIKMQEFEALAIDPITTY